MRRHRRHRRRGIAYRLTRIVAVVTLVVWGGLLLAAMFNYNKPPASDKEQLATKVVPGEQIATQTDAESARAPKNSKTSPPSQGIKTSQSPAQVTPETELAENQSEADAAADRPEISRRDQPGFDESPNKAGKSGMAPQTAATTSRAEEPGAEPQTDEIILPARQSDAAEKDTVESDTARFETAPETFKSTVSVSSDHIARAQFTTRIDAREPTDRVETVFPSNGQSIRTLFYFTEITGLDGETVTHRWEHEGQVVAEVSFDVGSDRWRVYSSKDLNQAMKGDWRVVVTDSQGQVLKTESFAYDES